MYFGHISKLVKEANPDASLKFKKISKLKTLEKSSTNVAKIAAFDYDLNKNNFEEKVKLCNETRVLYSNLNFDLWLVLHKEQYMKKVQNNNDYVDKVRKLYWLPSNADIKKEANIQQILNQIELKDVKRAIKNANKIMDEKIEFDKIYVKRNFYYFPNPSMNIHKFFEELFKEIGL